MSRFVDGNNVNTEHHDVNELPHGFCEASPVELENVDGGGGTMSFFMKVVLVDVTGNRHSEGRPPPSNALGIPRVQTRFMW